MAGNEPVDRGPLPVGGPAGEDVEAALAALTPRLRALDDTPAPDSSFVARLEEDLMDHAGYAHSVRRPFAPNGLAARVAIPSMAPPEPAARRWPLTQLLVAAVLLLALAVGGAGDRFLPADPDSEELRLGALQPATPTAEGTPARTLGGENDAIPASTAVDAGPTPTDAAFEGVASPAPLLDVPTPTVEIGGEPGRDGAGAADPTPTVEGAASVEPMPTVSTTLEPVLGSSNNVADLALDPDSREETIRTDPDAVLAGDPDAVEDVRRQLREAFARYATGCRAGFVLISGNGEIGQGNEVARAIEGILREEFPDLFGAAVAEVFAVPGGEPRGEVGLQTFFFQGCQATP